MNILKLMKTLQEYMTVFVTEGGMGGHMKHPIDYLDFTANDLCELVHDLFGGNIEDITEKIDGVNIQATMNSKGEVVFIRNKTDLNSEKGGMTVDDMARKWADKPGVANTFVSAGKIIEKVFEKVGKKFFNPTKNIKCILNCECVSQGITNVIPYGSAQVDFHDIWTYKFDGKEWNLTGIDKNGLDIIKKACESVDSAQITPQLVVQMTKESEKIIKEYDREIQKLFKEPTETVDQWRLNHYMDEIRKDKSYAWIADSAEGARCLYERWFNANKSLNIRKIKEYYPEHLEDLAYIDKNGYKELVKKVIEPLDVLFMKIGNTAIKMCTGMINTNTPNVVKTLTTNLKDAIADIKKDPDPNTQFKLLQNLQRLENVGGESSINPAEGIVFRYKGRLMKLTGTFAPLNQILGLKKFD